MSLLNQFLLSTTVLTRGDLVATATVNFRNQSYSNVGELIMSVKLTASYNPPNEKEEPEEIQEPEMEAEAVTPNADVPVIIDETEKDLTQHMNHEFANVLAHLLYKHYHIENVAIGTSPESLEDHTSAISVLFSKGVVLNGRERLEILEKLSSFLSDLQNIAGEMSGIEINTSAANEREGIFALIYEPATMGAALGLMVEKFAPQDLDMGTGLRDAAVFFERVHNYVPAHQMN